MDKYLKPPFAKPPFRLSRFTWKTAHPTERCSNSKACLCAPFPSLILRGSIESFGGFDRPFLGWSQISGCKKETHTTESKTPIIGTEENHDSQRRDRILHFSLRPEIGQFSPHFGVISLLNYTENMEKRETYPLESSKFKQKSSGDGAPKLQISVLCRGRTCPDIRFTTQDPAAPQAEPQPPAHATAPQVC